MRSEVTLERSAAGVRTPAERQSTRGLKVSVWVWILIILLIVLLLGGFGYSRR